MIYEEAKEKETKKKYETFYRRLYKEVVMLVTPARLYTQILKVGGGSLPHCHSCSSDR
jgi:hypothetical protein